MSYPLQPDHHSRAMLEELVIGSRRDILRRRDMLAYDAPNETDHQIMVAISGTAGNGASYTDYSVGFDVWFNSATLQRSSSFRWPFFTYGYVIDTPAPIMVWTHVKGWVTDGNNMIIGADMTYGSMAPELPPDGTTSAFSGALHLNFQGLGAPYDVGNDGLAFADEQQT